MRLRKPKRSRGFTLLEVLIVLGIFSLFTAGVFQLLLSLQTAQAHQEREAQELQAVRAPLYQMLRELRLVGYPGRSSFGTADPAAGLIAAGFIQVTSTDVVFEADLDLNGTVERIEYRVAADGQRLSRVVYPKLLDGSYGGPVSSQAAFVQNLVNSTLATPLPVFSWEVDAASLEPFPNNIALVYVSLAVEARLDPRDPTKTQILHLAGAARRINPGS